MRLTTKLTLGLVVAILPVIAVSAGVRADREIDASAADVRADDIILGRTVAGAVATVWRSAGEQEARLLVDGANHRQHRVRIRWVWLDVSSRDLDAPFIEPTLLGPLVDGQPRVVLGAPGGGGVTLLTYVAVTTPGGRHGAIEVRRSLAAEQSFVRHAIFHAATATGSVVALCGCLALGLGVVLVGRPVNRLVAQTRRIGAGDLSTRLRMPQGDELGQLGGEIDIMCDRLAEARDRLATETAAKIAALEQVRHADRLATVGKLAAGIAHELGTPLNVISGHAQLITDVHEPGSSDFQNAAIVIEQTQRVSDIIRQLLDFARRRTPRRAPLALGPLVTETLALLAPLASERRISIDLTLWTSELVSSADRGQLQQAVTNLIVNALHATPTAGRISVIVARRRIAPPDRPGTEAEHAWIEVVDHGSGISPDVLPHIFEPFFTTKDVGRGTGLGLAVTYGIVKEHDGWIDVVTKLGEGSRFAIVLPLDRPANQRKANSWVHV